MEKALKFIKSVAGIGIYLGGFLIVCKVVVWVLNLIGYLQTLQLIVGWIPWRRINESSWWIAPSICVVCLILFLIAMRPEKQTIPKDSKSSSIGNAQPVPSAQAGVPIIPAQNWGLSPQELADPYYDRLFGLSGWRDGLIRRGQPLMEQWTTRLDYPEKQRRENESKNWLSEANQFARKHLTGEQLDQFMQNYRTAAMKPVKKYEFSMALKGAGTEAGTEDHDLAFEIACKIKLLERFRENPSAKSQSSAVTEVVAETRQIVTKNPAQRHFTLSAMREAGIGNLDTEEEFQSARRAIIQHNIPDPLVGLDDLWPESGQPKWLAVIKLANQKQVDLTSATDVLDFINEHYEHFKPPS